MPWETCEACKGDGWVKRPGIGSDTGVCSFCHGAGGKQVASWSAGANSSSPKNSSTSTSASDIDTSLKILACIIALITALVLAPGNAITTGLLGVVAGTVSYAVLLLLKNLIMVSAKVLSGLVKVASLVLIVTLIVTVLVE